MLSACQKIYETLPSSETQPAAHVPEGEASWHSPTAQITTILTVTHIPARCTDPAHRQESTNRGDAACSGAQSYSKTPNLRPDREGESVSQLPRWSHEELKAQTVTFPSAVPPMRSAREWRWQQHLPNPKSQRKWMLTLCEVLLPGLKLRSAGGKKK